MKKRSSLYLFKKIVLKSISLIFLSGAVLKILSFEELLLLWEEQFNLELITLSVSLILIILIEFSLSIVLWKEHEQGIVISIILLIFFIFVAMYQFSISAENCACFGTFISLSPLETIVKNIVLIALLVISYQKKGV